MLRLFPLIKTGVKTSIARRLSLPVLVAMGMAGCSHLPAPPVKVKLLAVNDFHGYLLPSPLLQLDVPDTEGGPDAKVNVGGAAYLASLINGIRSQTPNTLFVGVGDFVGGSPAISTWTAGEATIEAMNRMGLEVTSVGNHEFDRGKQELKRLQSGGCAQGAALSDPLVRSCTRTGSFEGARFPYLAANVIDNDTGELLFPATHVRQVGQAKLGFIGLTLRDTPQTTRGAQGLTFLDEVKTVEQHASRLRQEGVDAVIVLLHEGGSTTASSFKDQSCPGLTGPVKSIVSAFPSTVDVVLSGHTHYDYICQINGILLSQAGSYGRMVTEIDLSIVPGQGVVSKAGRTLPVINDLTTRVPKGYTILSANREVAELVNFYDQLTLPQRSRSLGFIASDILRADIDGSGQLVRSGTRINVADHPIGRVFADAMLAIPSPDGLEADVAFINPGGLRNYVAMQDGGKVDYETVFSVAPFGDALYRVEMTGESLIRLLEQQWEAPNCSGKNYLDICGRVLQPSHTLNYTWVLSPEDQGQPAGTGRMVDVSSVRIKGKPIDLNAVYRIVTVEYLAVYGGDKFSAFTERRLRIQNMAATDMEALQAYFSRYTEQSPLMRPSPRIRCILKATRQDCGIPVL